MLPRSTLFLNCQKYFRILLFHSALFIILPALSLAQTVDTTNAVYEEQINALFDSVMASDKFVEKLDSGSFYNLPLGIMGGDNNDPSYALLIDEVVLYPDKATFSASMVLTNPSDGNKMVFAAREVPFTFSGGIQGDIRLELISEKPVNICEDIGLEILKGSYVEANCNGFKSLHIKGRVKLNEEKYVKADLQGKRKEGEVSAFFETTVQNWNDLTFSISLDPFQLKKYPDFTFSCQNLSVDFSDVKNPTELKFPDGYDSFYPNDVINLWRGIYIGQASIILNKEKFKRQNSATPLSFGVQDLIIDEMGFSGKVFATGLLPLENGNLGSWKFSIDELYLEFYTNDLTGGGMKGLVHVPVFEDSTNFQYSAFVDIEGNYSFTVSPDDTMSFNMFGRSKLELYETSFINITSDSNGFIPTACLNGKMSINAAINSDEGQPVEDGKTLNLAELEFQNFRISTREPLVDIEYMAYHGSGQGKLSKFPITINDIVFRSKANEAKLSITASVNLKKDSEEGFSGKTTISVLANRVDYKYHFAGVQVDLIEVHVKKKGAFEINGSIAFARGDETYGDGFRGELDATFSDNLEINALAIFGNVNGMRYFFVDGMVAMRPGIQAGPITFFGFGGGLFHHMKQKTGVTDPNSFGASSSGIVYEPYEAVALGIRATVKVGIVKEEIINAQATFEIAFTNSGGISNIGFEGIAECISPPINIDINQFSQLTQQMLENQGVEQNVGGNAAISARLMMNKDFITDEFHAELEVFVNVAGVITGVGNNNRAGWAVVHISPEEWYMHIGTPSDPIGLQLLGLAKVQSYFMAGHRLPATLPIHPKVAQILNISPEDVSGKRDQSAVENARGVAFGASFEISTGDLSFLIFYGSFELGAGFDIMLANYGSGAYCEGHAPPLGVNGWYAQGQAYAYFSGKIGLQARVFGKTKKFEILSIATAAYLRAEGPNPMWLVGYVGGQYRILGGLIKGRCRFEAEVGERCDIQGAQSILASLQLIGDVSPAENEKDVDVFTTPQVVFNVPVEKMQKISENDGSSTYFRIKLVNMSIKEGEQDVPFESRWNSAKDVVQLIPAYVLYPETDYSIEVEIAFEEKVDGVWQAFEHEGEQLTEEKLVSYTTGELPDRIPDDEISYSYPIDRQFNFLQGEYDKAYLIFRRDLQAFFAPSETYHREARWTRLGALEELHTNIQYVSGEKTVYMDLPASLALNAIYSLELVAIPVAESDAADRNVTTTYNEQDTGDDSTTIEQKERTAEGTITTTEEKVMHDLHFKTSQYTDFNSRFSENNLNVRALYDAGYMEFLLFCDIPGGEALDIYEQPAGNRYSLIRAEAVLPNTEWFNNYVYPRTYENYPWFGHHAIRWRDTLKYGRMAQGAIAVGQPISFSALTDEDIEAGYPISHAGYSDIVYMQPYYWDEDYMQIRDELAYDTRDMVVTDPMINTILTNIKLRAVKPGDYPVKLSYVLPGKMEVTSSKTITITSTFKTDAEDF